MTGIRIHSAGPCLSSMSPTLVNTVSNWSEPDDAAPSPRWVPTQTAFSQISVSFVAGCNRDTLLGGYVCHESHSLIGRILRMRLENPLHAENHTPYLRTHNENSVITGEKSIMSMRGWAICVGEAEKASCFVKRTTHNSTAVRASCTGGKSAWSGAITVAEWGGIEVSGLCPFAGRRRRRWPGRRRRLGVRVEWQGSRWLAQRAGSGPCRHGRGP